MRIKFVKFLGSILVLMLTFFNVAGQISPGDLSNLHSHLEGISNCTKCHVLGNKVSNDKCLSCHTEIQSRINIQKGYHSSVEVKGKECIICHNEHHGKSFELIRFDIDKFDHNLTGYNLSVPHAKQKCSACHTNKNISNQNIKDKKYTYLGLGTECLSCHDDYHKKTLSSTCLNCHNPDVFKPAPKFNHANARYPLVGKHKNVECIKCHPVDQADGNKFQKFIGIQYGSCISCHKDPHKNKYGQNCNECHSEASFKNVKISKNFDHNKTKFPLEGKHLDVSCQKCHKTKFTNPVKHERCTDCHPDYHKKQFAKNGVSPDCSKCHNVKGFNIYSYSIEDHNKSTFPLEGAHEAIPCIECHKKQKVWDFKGIGIECKDCHKDIHQNIIPGKYYADGNCKICHSNNNWNDIAFDHSQTGYNLTDAHLSTTCSKCHITRDEKGIIQQKFTGLSQDCSNCHKDNHLKQFEKSGTTNCTGCHDTQNWKATKFDHNNTAFKLEGKHISVPCAKCHKPQKEGTVIYIKYKLKEFKCESCHS